MWHAWDRRKFYKIFVGKPEGERDHSEDGGVDGRMGSEWILGRLIGSVWTTFAWFRVGTGGRLFSTRG
jgi:hypothetical protein